MRANFHPALKATLAFEGGYSNHPHDPGGPTNRGITIATLSHELGRAATIDEVKTLGIDTAASIYRKKYWNLVGGDELPGGVDALAFDICVNSGPGRTLPWLAKTSHLASGDRIEALDRYRRNFWQSLAIYHIFGRGWMAREDAMLRLARSLAPSGATKKENGR